MTKTAHGSTALPDGRAPITKPGTYPRFPEDHYHGDPCPAPSLSSSLVRELVRRTPLHAMVRHPRLSRIADELAPAGDRLDIGRLAHRLFLERSEGILEVVDAPDWRSKAARAARDAARAAGRVALLRPQYERVREMVEVLEAQYRDIMGAPRFEPETSLFWQEGGVWCRARVDGLGEGVAFDLKTTGIPVTRWAEHTFWTERVDIQAAWYLRGLEALGRPVDRFLIIVQETDPPFAAAVFEVDQGSLCFARRDCGRAVGIWRRCIETRVWPGYPPMIHRLQMPEWIERRMSDRELAREVHGDEVDRALAFYRQMLGEHA